MKTATRIVPLLVLLLCAHAAGEEPAAETAPAYESKLAKLPAPSAAGGLHFEGEFTAGGGQLTGTAKVEAKPTTTGGAAGWATRVHIEAPGVLSLEETGIYDAHLRPVSGVSKRVTPAGTEHNAWKAVDGAVELTNLAATAEDGTPPAAMTIKHEGVFQADVAAMFLFCKLIEQEAGSFETDLFVANETKFVRASWKTGAAGTWKGKAAKIVRGTRADGKTLEAGFDAASGKLLGATFGQGGQVAIELFLPAPQGFFDVPAKTPQQAGAQAGLAFIVADFDLLERVTHWPTIAAAHTRANPDEPLDGPAAMIAFMEEFRKVLKPQADRKTMAPMIEQMAPNLKTTKGEDATSIVDFGPMFRNLKIHVGEIDGVWYLVRFPSAPK